MIGIGCATLTEPIQALLNHVLPAPHSFAESFNRGLEPLAICMLCALLLIAYAVASLVWPVVLRWADYKPPWWSR
jgi:hypothetical protein